MIKVKGSWYLYENDCLNVEMVKLWKHKHFVVEAVIGLILEILCFSIILLSLGPGLELMSHKHDFHIAVTTSNIFGYTHSRSLIYFILLPDSMGACLYISLFCCCMSLFLSSFVSNSHYSKLCVLPVPVPPFDCLTLFPYKHFLIIILLCFSICYSPEWPPIKNMPFVVAFPSHWTPLDTSRDWEVVKLRKTSEEYKQVASEFIKSLDSGSNGNRKVKEVFRVQNPFVWQKYVT